MFKLVGICLLWLILCECFEGETKSFQQQHASIRLKSGKALPYGEEYVDQYIDHFNYGGPAGPDGMYKQRYLIQGICVIIF